MYFIVGSSAGLLCIGLFSDLLTKGKYIYFHITCNVAVALFVVFIDICYDFAHDKVFSDCKSYVCAIYGFLGSMLTILVYYVLPLYVTAKEREKHSYFEIPMAAQIFAMVNVIKILLAIIDTALTVSSSKTLQVIGFLLGCCSIVPLLPYVKHEWVSIKSGVRVDNNN